MPGYGLLDARPHVMPVWGVWMDEALWFGSSRGSRKARNLVTNAHCAVTTDNACYRVRPVWAFGLTEADFTGTPTRWTFPPRPA